MITEEKILLTQEKKDELKAELKRLVEVERGNVIKQLQEAREQGDLSENADYDAAKNLQAEVERRISEIEHQVNFADVIKETNGKIDKVAIGSWVDILDMADKQTYTFTIVGEVETDPDNNKISNHSPLAKAILGKKVDSVVEVKGIREPYNAKILKIYRK